MADINSIIKFSKDSISCIDTKVKGTGFSYRNWGDKDLLDVRKEIRNFYRKEQLGKCCYCRQNVSLVSANNCHIEHIVPKSLHPEYIFTPKNLCIICADCNQIKNEQETIGDIPDTIENASGRKQYPRSSNAFKIVHPHFDNYDEHILITNGYYIDKDSKKGNFTIGACRLNRKLGMFGWEPNITDESKLCNEMNKYLEEKDSNKRNLILSNIKKILF